MVECPQSRWRWRACGVLPVRACEASGRSGGAQQAEGEREGRCVQGVLGARESEPVSCSPVLWVSCALAAVPSGHAWYVRTPLTRHPTAQHLSARRGSTPRWTFAWVMYMRCSSCTHRYTYTCPVSANKLKSRWMLHVMLLSVLLQNAVDRHRTARVHIYLSWRPVLTCKYLK